MARGNLVRFAALVGMAVVVAGCGSRMSMSNYEKVKDGMSETEVVSILGKGEEAASSAINVPGQSIDIPGAGNVSVAGISASSKVLKWQDGMKVITVQFMNGKVMSKAQAGL